MGTTENTEFTERAGHDPPRLLYSKLTAGISQVAYDVHAYFGPGFLEKVYENALANRLHNAGHQVAQQASLKVRDFDGAIVGQYVADIVVDNRILVEVKAVSTLTHNH